VVLTLHPKKVKKKRKAGSQSTVTQSEQKELKSRRSKRTGSNLIEGRETAPELKAVCQKGEISTGRKGTIEKG